MKTTKKQFLNRLTHLLLFLIFALFLGTCKKDIYEDPHSDPPSGFNITNFMPAWSPDGQWIAFERRRLGEIGIYLISPDGEKIEKWHSGIASAPSWSPDGQWIAFSENAKIWKKKINGDSLTQLTFEGRNFFPAWSPDGKKIVNHQSNCTELVCGLWLINLNDTTHTPIVPYGLFPDFHPINNTILYQRRWVDNSGKVYGDSLFYYDYKIARSLYFMVLQGQNYKNTYFKINSDGSKIAFTSKSRHDTLFQIWTINTDGTGLKQLTETQGFSCDWSPDGKQIVYTDSRAENGRLWIMDADGSNKKQLTFKHHFNF